MSSERSLHLQLMANADVDQDELSELTARLRSSLLETEVTDVSLGRAGSIPEGARAGEAIAVGALAVSLAPSVVRSVFHVVETWMQHRPLRSVKITLDGRTIELTNASSEQQSRLVEAFIQSTADDGR
jgi:hypothetical protein